MFRECPRCKRTYRGSWAGAMFHNANPNDKIGYFGGYCECGIKLGESYNYEGIEIVEGDLSKIKHVYSSEWSKWKNSLSAAQYRKIFGGLPNQTIYRLNYSETFLANSKTAAEKKFLKLVKILRRQIVGKARLALARLYGEKWTESKEVWLAEYVLQSARSPESVRDYLELKRRHLAVPKRY